MDSPAPLRSRLEMAIGGLSALVFAATLVWPDWIERLFGVEPDGGDGSAEWGWAMAFAVLALLLFADAGRIWRRAARAMRGDAAPPGLCSPDGAVGGDGSSAPVAPPGGGSDRSCAAPTSVSHGRNPASAR